MSYIGSTPTNQSFIAGTDSFNGTGAQTNFTLSRLVNSVNDVQVVVNNVVQYPPNYSVSGNTLTISPAPSSGTNNVYVRYLSTTLQSVTPPGGTTVNGSWGVNGDLNFYGNARRITGDFSNATIANRVLVQNSTTNAQSNLGVVSNGSGNGASVQLFPLSTLTNSAFGSLLVQDTSDFRITSGILGSGSYVPITFYTGGSERARIDTSGNFQFNSGYGSVATAYGCRAWVNFNGTGTVAIRASGNVSSITDNGTGNYTVNFTNAMPDRNYAVAQSAGRNDTGYAIAGSTTTPTTTAYVVTTYNGSFATSQDGSEIYVSVFR